MTNFDKIVHVMYEVYNVKPPYLDERAANIAAQLMDQVDAGVKPDIDMLVDIADVDARVAVIASDYIARFIGEGVLSEGEWEELHESDGFEPWCPHGTFFGDDRRPVPTDILHSLKEHVE